MPNPSNTSLGSLLSKISKKDSVDEFGKILRTILKEELRISQQYTFEELKGVVKRKKTDPYLKEEIVQLLNELAELEYKPRKPSSQKIAQVKKQLRSIVKRTQEGKPQAKKKKEETKQEKIVKKVDKVKRKIHKEVETRVKEKKVEFDENDKEIKAIRKFVQISLESGVKKQKIRKELRSMGFSHKKVLFALSSSHN